MSQQHHILLTYHWIVIQSKGRKWDKISFYNIILLDYRGITTILTVIHKISTSTLQLNSHLYCDFTWHWVLVK